MMGRTHALSGAAVWACAAGVWHAAGVPAAPGPAVVVVGAALAAAAALAPDLDHPDSMAAHAPQVVARHVSRGICRALPRTRQWRDARKALQLAVKAAGWVLALPTRAVAWVIHRALGHRGPTHSLPAAASVGVVALLVAWWAPCPWWWGAAIAAGYMIHLAGDVWTVSGIPLWWPVTPRRCRAPWTFRTGAKAGDGDGDGGEIEPERVIRGVLWLAAAAPWVAAALI